MVHITKSSIENLDFTITLVKKMTIEVDKIIEPIPASDGAGVKP